MGVVGDRSYAALEVLHHCQSLRRPVTFITRLRLDAALDTPVPAYTGKVSPTQDWNPLTHATAGPEQPHNRLVTPKRVLVSTNRTSS